VKPQVWVLPNETRIARVVDVRGLPVRVIPVVVTHLVGELVHEDGTVNDSGLDLAAWQAEWQGRRAIGETPEAAAQAAVKPAPMPAGWQYR
jgi:hypothetical protein